MECSIQGIKRDYKEPDCYTRTPLTRPFLLCILNCLALTDYDDVVLKAAFTLAFAGFLRVGEFTYKQADKELGPTFPNWFLTKGCIKTRASGGYMEVTLPASKTDPFRKGINLTIATSYDNACPVSAMKQSLARDTHRAPHEPIFCIGRYEQRALTREYIVLKLQQLAITAGLGEGMWNSHSFCRGAAMWAAEVRISESEIQTLGR